MVDEGSWMMRRLRFSEYVWRERARYGYFRHRFDYLIGEWM